ncbi:hypothetical protein CLV43_106531 [Umezawaea tangerina]|uniref:YD repeat-containing protein n=1 Tax=Umezawaea tangerina TaxID=84725 RepID=A0A2T0T543_9PSEU|nr:hypothetical protein CLV43_106531 [Umezawaea tangerina]
MLPGKSVIVLMAVATACALLASTAVTAVVATGGGPESCCGGAAGGAEPVGSPSPSARPSSSRPAGPSICLVGSWRSVDETFMVKFYTNQPEMRFTGSGREFEFRPDGTIVERQKDFVITTVFQGRELRMVGNGSIEYRWAADDKAVTYSKRGNSSLTWAYYDQRGLINTELVTGDTDYTEVDEYTCEGKRVVENGKTGYRSVWERTSAFGVYG